ncbi:CDP-diacylglycerol/glycerol-3-phosphate 3-phosphatidyltransferase [Ruminiclostridium papyrosolvens DSM 2782]|uniref:CDP-diacylglycerol--glycerol-3-phosphate 3-phosphatidyltransferase n=1 Tax=Ruminiclostridium papyrosolvens DSM 2782 TaxID=588581 RepID=F1TEV4_9FIRM|nr:CDP-diacylglycerol--glycerol-3-phosphate 3-phosphatidyltransferase [Ruminiclostridium papyrosolvens]EGD47270.1 CDP-diacylglycerol/glycerol-3-phosphate 3-phosphatidyltransferase [Ruminiclostridium papyrosolvens DSM 2782]WES36309.1 CDP-diacylglycerol--glycerol-3-phosphate 3-phosphatidyltransferase [Ruminiclostridium papyrosolvens DSM 2782]
MNLPNKITISRIFLVPLFMIFVIPIPDATVNFQLLSFMKDEMLTVNSFINSYGSYVAAVLFILAASTDGVDGYIARKHKLVTAFGKFLDPIADKLLITAALIALVQQQVVTGWAAMIIISRELLVTGLRLVAAGEGQVIAANKSGKVKMVFQTVAVSVCLLKNWPFSIFTDLPVDSYLMFVAVIITIYSGIDFFAKNLKILKSGGM